jgi:Leucine-rich repeat (LRR) protein
MCEICTNSFTNATVLLDCSNCPSVRKLPEDLPMLKYLCVNGTQIASIPNYPKLEGLYMSKCINIREIPDFANLKKLNAQGSILEKLPDSLYSLEFLDVSNTKVKEIPPTLISLVTLKMSGCSLINSVSSRLINLESLSAQGTSLRDIQPLMSLTYINVSNTLLQSLPMDNLPSLRKVVAMNCQFTDPFAIIEKGVDFTA